MGLETLRKEIALKAGETAKNNAVIEVRTGAAKDILLPQTIGFLKYTAEAIKPITSSITKGLSSGLHTELGSTGDPRITLSGLMNLGGIKIHISSSSSVSYFFGFCPKERSFYTIVGFKPKVAYPQTIFEACSILSEKDIPKILLRNGEFAWQRSYKIKKDYMHRESSLDEINILEFQADWFQINVDEFRKYLTQVWEFICETTFDVAQS